MSVTLRFELSDVDIAVAEKMVRRSANDGFWTYLLCIGFAVQMLDLYLYGGRGAERTILAVGILLLTAISLAHFLRARAMKRQREKLGLLEYTFSEDEIRFRDSELDCKLKWSYYKRFKETPEHYFLLTNGTQMAIIPKSAFTSEEQRREFLALINNIRQSVPVSSRK